MTTKPCVFIIESLSLDNEEDDLFEGEILSKILRLSGSEPEYVYLRTRQKLLKAIEKFKKSKYRYLHFSCHGNEKGIALTDDDISFKELSDMLTPCLYKRRVFFSSCKVMNEHLAEALLKNTGCYSVVGPYKNIKFDRAAAYWSSFYHLMLRDESTFMRHEMLKQHTALLQNIFGVHMRYFSTSRKAASGFKEVDL